ILTVVGIDETSAQNLHARHTYGHEQIRWGARHADMLSERPDGRLQLDMREFHRLVPTSPTSAFPYPRLRARGRSRLGCRGAPRTGTGLSVLSHVSPGGNRGISLSFDITAALHIDETH